MSNKAASKRPVARTEMTKAQWTWKEMKKNKVAYLMVAPFMILFLVFTVFPVVLSMALSFTDFNMLQMPHWVGGSNGTCFLHSLVAYRVVYQRTFTEGSCNRNTYILRTFHFRSGLPRMENNVLK